MTPEQQHLVNEALATFQESYFSAEARQRLTARYGEEIARMTEAVYHQAMDCPVNWHTTTMDEALDVLHQFFDEHYPWLTAPARTRLNYAFMMTWK